MPDRRPSSNSSCVHLSLPHIAQPPYTASRVPAEVKAATMRDLQLHPTRVQKPTF
jgi:hypothetical protein